LNPCSLLNSSDHRRVRDHVAVSATLENHSGFRTETPVSDDVDLNADYEAAGFKRSLKPGDSPALLVIDFVNAYLDPDSPLYAGVEDALGSAARVLTAARSSKTPVVYTKVIYTPGGTDGGIFYRKIPVLEVFDAGSPLGEIPGELAPEPGEIVIYKQYASAFFGTSLASTLTALGIDTVVIVGLSTSGCVRASAVDAMQYGFIPIVVADAVGDRDPRPHEANLFDLQAKYAEVVGEDDAVKYLRSIRRDH
jgi:nicotinamidase-related amidase